MRRRPGRLRPRLLVLGLLVGCPGAPQAPARTTAHSDADSPPAPTASLDVLFAGCGQVLPGPRCVIPSDTARLRLWAPIDPTQSITLTLDDEPLTAEPQPVAGGQRFAIEVPATAGRLELRAPGQRFELLLSPDRSEAPTVVTDLLSRGRGGEDPAVLRQELLAALPPLTGTDRVAALRRLAQWSNELQQPARALEYFEQGFLAAVDAGRPGDASRLAQTAAWTELARRYDSRAAQAWLDRDRQASPHDPQGQLTRAYYQALIDQRRGDLSGALRAFAEQARLARALDDSRLEAAALSEQLLLLGQLGAYTQAQPVRERAEQLAPKLNPIDRAIVLDSAGLMLLEARGRGHPAADPAPLLQRGLAALDPQQPAHAGVRGSILLNLAYAAIVDGRHGDARAWLQQAEGAPLRRGEVQWQRLLVARLWAADGKLEPAMTAFAQVAEQAATVDDIPLRWQALVDGARALEASGQPDEALTRYRAAERLLDAQLPKISLALGRGRFVAERNEATRAIVRLLLARGQTEPALCAARLARTRALRTVATQVRTRSRATARQRGRLDDYLDERARIEDALDASAGLPLEEGDRTRARLLAEQAAAEQQLDALLAELVPTSSATADDCGSLRGPRAGRLDLYYVVDPPTGAGPPPWRLFVASPSGVKTHALGPVPPAPTDPVSTDEERRAWGEFLLGPIAAQLRDEPPARVRIVASGPLLRIPFAALTVPGSPGAPPLLALTEVVYGLDLPATPSADDRPGPPRAAVLAPPSNLAHATRETAVVVKALAQLGVEVDRLEHDAVTGAAARQRLRTTDWLHYVGHADSSDSTGWDSALRLAGDGTLRVGDVLASAHVPAAVILNGCETGANDPRALAGGLGLAHAFILTGSDTVVATTHVVDDETAAALVATTYAGLSRADPEALVTAVRRAQRARAARDRAWMHTRIWRP